MRIGKKMYWMFQAIGWGLFAMINIFFAYSFDKLNTPGDSRLFFFRLVIFVISGLVLTHIMRYLIIGMEVLQKKLERQLFQFLVITIFFAFVASTIYTLLLINQGLLTKTEKEFQNNVFLLVLSSAFYFFIYFFIWNLIYFVYHYVGKSRKQQLDTLRLETLVKELELKTIKSHINPHFIFN